jgi:hypothetical protein
MCPKHLNGLSTGFLWKLFALLSFVSSESTQSFFRRLCLLLNICSFEGILDQSCTRIISFGPSAPSTYSSQVSGPSNYLFRAISAFDIFESGLRTLELSLLGHLRLRHIRVRSPDPQIISFGPAAPSIYSSQVSGPSNYLFRAISAFDIFESGLRSLELSLSTLQRLRDIRGRALIFRVASFDPIIPSENPGSNFGSLNHPFRMCPPSCQRSSINMPKSWWQYTSSDAVCQIRR